MLKEVSKQILYSSLFKTGLFQKGQTGKRLILMYHGVTEKDHTGYFGRHLPAKQFEKHLTYFKKHFNIISLEELLKGSAVSSGKGSSIRKPSIALTFDDGFENNLSVALPLLEKHRIPATFYVCTFALNKQDVLYADIIDAVRVNRKEKELEFGHETYIRQGRHRLLNKNDGSNIYEKLVTLSARQLQKAITEFSTRYDAASALGSTDQACYRLMNEAQVKQLSSSSFAHVGSHCKEHLALSTCDEPTLKNELQGSKEALESITGKKVDSIAFPYGDHNATIVEQSKKAGYSTLLSAGQSEFKEVLPRAGIISAGSFEQNMIHVHRSFEVFEF